MTATLTPPPTSGAVPDGPPARYLAAVAAAVQASVADNTRAAYAGDWAHFTAWCAEQDQPALPADPVAVAGFLASSAELRRPDGRPAYAPATLTRWAASINAAHTAAGHPSPGRTEVVRRTLAGIRKIRATPPRRVRPLRLVQLRTVTLHLRDQATTGPLASRLAAHRDSAVILLGLFGAFRSSELAGLSIGDAVLDDDGVTVTVRLSKTDQQSAGQIKAIPRRCAVELCGPCALIRWRRLLDAAETGGHPATLRALHTAGPLTDHVCRTEIAAVVDPARPLFRPFDPAGAITTRPLAHGTIRHLIRARAAAAGLPAGVVDRLGSHSLRAGFVTDALAGGAQPHEVMRQTGHRNQATVEIYRRDNPHVGNAVNRLDL